MRHIYIPKEVREPIQKGYIADELTLTREQETTTAKTEANLREAEQKVLLEAAKITEETKKLVAERQGHRPTDGRADGGRHRAKGGRDRPPGRRDRRPAGRDPGRGRERRPRSSSSNPRPNSSSLAVKAFGEPAAYTQWEFAEGLPENIDLKMIYSGAEHYGPTSRA